MESTTTYARRACSVKEAAALLGIAPKRVYEGIWNGIIPSVNVGPKRILVPLAWLEEKLQIKIA